MELEAAKLEINKKDSSNSILYEISQHSGVFGSVRKCVPPLTCHFYAGMMIDQWMQDTLFQDNTHVQQKHWQVVISLIISNFVASAW